MNPRIKVGKPNGIQQIHRADHIGMQSIGRSLETGRHIALGSQMEDSARSRDIVSDMATPLSGQLSNIWDRFRLVLILTGAAN